MSNNGLMAMDANSSKLVQKQIESINDTIFGTFYNTGGGKGSKQVPDSRIIQGLANKYKVKTQEVFSEQTDDYAKVVVGATAPNGVYQEDIVIHNFTAILQEKIVNLFEKELEAKKDFESRPVNKEREFKPVFFIDMGSPFELQSNGTIIPSLTLKGQIKLFKDMTRFKTFATRDAYSKAANRAQKRVLNQEFRDEIEIELEDDEVKKVNNGKVSKESVQYEMSESKDDKVSEANMKDVKKDLGIKDSDESVDEESNSDSYIGRNGLLVEKVTDESENNPVTEAVADYDKRQENGFKTADQVPSTDPDNDHSAESYIKQVIYSLKEKNEPVNESSIKAYVADCVKDTESDITMKEANQVIKQLNKVDLKALI